MKSLLEQVNDLDALIRSLRKVESKVRSGQIIDAWREILRIISFLERAKQCAISGNKSDSPKLKDSDEE